MLIADKENELALNISDNITELPIAGATADVEGFLSHTAMIKMVNFILCIFYIKNKDNHNQWQLNTKTG